MIHWARAHSHTSSEHCFLLFCFSRFETWGCTDMCENNDPYDPTGRDFGLAEWISTLTSSTEKRKSMCSKSAEKPQKRVEKYYFKGKKAAKNKGKRVRLLRIKRFIA